MTGKQRRSVLFIALAGTAVWSAWLAFNEPAQVAETIQVEGAKPLARTTHAPSGNNVSSPAMIPIPPQETAPRLALSRTNLFPEQPWYVPPPPPPPPPYVAPPPPQAPALPFSYMGRWQEAGQTTYYLTSGTTPVSVQSGQILDGDWRLETVANGMLNFTYLPLKQTRSLRTGE
ncbi:MAG: hypothetical protein ACYCZA_13995 [Thiobacillus sp.]